MAKKQGSALPSVNGLAAPLVDTLADEAVALRLAVSEGEAGERLIDCGAGILGGVEAGRRMGEICLGGLGTVTIEATGSFSPYSFSVTVHTSNPVIACLGSQYAGWTLTSEEGEPSYYVLGSGPGRALGSSEPLFEELHYRDKAKSGVLVLEADAPPPKALTKRVAKACGLKPEDLTFVYAPTQSLAGGVQVVARSLEVALHKAHELHFPLENIVDGLGTAPLPPPGKDFISAMGRTNDAIIYAGRVQLYVKGSASAAKDLAEKLPSRTSKDYGRPFAEIFSAVKGDFYAIDKMLFSPAMVTVTALETGESFHGGGLDHETLLKSFD